MTAWHILTCEYPPDVGGVSDYTREVAEALADAGDEVHVWCPPVAGARAVSAVQVHADVGRFRPSDLRRVAARLVGFPAPRRLLVQWVPHGYGYRSMNLWLCLWLARRAMSGDVVELMVHEPFVELKRGPLRHVFIALVHRLMTFVMMQCVTRVWVSIPAWEPMLRPYTLGRRLCIGWLPIPACGGSRGSGPAPLVRDRYATSAQPLLGHFGSYGRDVAILLEERLVQIMDDQLQPAVLLIGARSEEFRAELAARHPAWASRLNATGHLEAILLAGYLEACDVLVQPYPDGITSRRTSAMTCLSLGRPVITTSGHLTEPFWAESGAVAMVDVSDAAGFVSELRRLLGTPEDRARIGQCARQLCGARFNVCNVVSALRAA